MMTLRFVLAVSAVGAVAGAQPSIGPLVRNGVIEISDQARMGYTIAVPRDAGPGEARPLILALHPGGGMRGGQFLLQIVEPALRAWNAVMVAPDSPTRAWSSDLAERGVLLLLDDVLEHHDIDRARILVTGFSMGGFGTWFFATHHPDRFAGAIPMAASPRGDPLDGLGSMPIHLIHSQDDTVVPIGPARAAAEALIERNHPVRFTELSGVGHFQMSGYIQALRDAGVWMQEHWEERPQ